MRFDVFFSICQSEVDGFIPTERVMFENFFDQVKLADDLGFETAWIAESHFSSEVQKTNPHPVIPHFKGEVGLNTDILQIAPYIFSQTKRIEVGSAIRNILCNGGPLAHAESIHMFLSLHGMKEREQRKIHVGFAAGRFDYSNKPYGIKPRNQAEQLAWNTVKPKIFLEAVEIFCRALRGETFSSDEIRPQILRKEDFKNPQDWEIFSSFYKKISNESISLEKHWIFETLQIVPKESRLELLDLIIGSHDPKVQILANEFLPCKVFNLSITPTKTIEETHERMKGSFNKTGGPWRRDYLPRTVLVFLEAGSQWSVQEQRLKARLRAQKCLETYWQAMEGTILKDRIEQAIDNSLCGCPGDIAAQLSERFHPEDRLMLWFDFNCHDNELIKTSMRDFAEKVIPLIAKRS